VPTANLTDAAVQRYKAPPGQRVDYFDMKLPGFALRVSGPTPRRPEGTKAWVLMYRFGGVKKRLTIEPGYPALGLADVPGGDAVTLAVKTFLYLRVDFDIYAPGGYLRIEEDHPNFWAVKLLHTMAGLVPEIAELAAPIIHEDAELIDADMEIQWARGGTGQIPGSEEKGLRCHMAPRGP
jgi:hypothetical protein